jgi:hypothetical protein
VPDIESTIEPETLISFVSLREPREYLARWAVEWGLPIAIALAARDAVAGGKK